jgi:ubiquinone/menaquinone biosynthesis C-methylase UbiE
MKQYRLVITTFLFSLILYSSLLANDESYRDSWQQSEKVMDVIGVKPGMVIGEPGAGEGYFTFKLSRRVGDTGKIYANDIGKRKLEKIKDRCKDEGINNIETILGKVEDPLFPKGVMDMVIMVYVFHELDKPVEFLKNIKPSMKPGATLVILERDPQKAQDTSGHFMEKEDLLKTVKKTEFELDRIETFLSWDNIYIYRLPGSVE